MTARNRPAQRPSPGPPGGAPAPLTLAFTLVELLLVLVIVATMAGAVAISFQGRQNPYAMKAAAEDLAEAIRYAMALATDRGQSCRVVFTARRDGYHVEIADLQSNDFVPAAGTAGRIRQMDRGVRVVSVRVGGEEIEPVPEQIEFPAGGGGFSGRIVLVSPDGDVVWVEVFPLAEQVNIREAPPE